MCPRDVANLIRYHHAKIAPEIDGVHDDVGLGWLRVALHDLSLLQTVEDGFATASMLRDKPCRVLLPVL